MAVAAYGQSTTTTTLSITSGGASVGTVKEGTVVTLTATVTLASGSAAAPPGQVNFCEVKAAPLQCTDIRLLGTVQMLSGGVAQFNFFPGPGTHAYRAVFLGTHLEASSSSVDTSLVVTPFYPTVTSLSSSGQPGDYTVTATVTTTGGTVPPTGTISLTDTDNSNYLLATNASLTPQSATYGLGFGSTTSFGNAASGIKSVVADFNGDGKPDVAYVTGRGSSPVVVVLGKGDGTFTEAPTVPSPR